MRQRNLLRHPEDGVSTINPIRGRAVFLRAGRRLRARTSRASWSIEKHRYLQKLEMLFSEASRNASIAARLGQGVLSDNWDAVEPYRTTLCRSARRLPSIDGEQAEEGDNSTTSLWPVMLQQPTLC